MVYRCIKCETVIDELPKGIIRCPNCAGKIFSKCRSNITKTIKAE